MNSYESWEVRIFIANFMECYGSFFKAILPDYHLPERIIWNMWMRKPTRMPKNHDLASKLEIAAPLRPLARLIPRPQDMLLTHMSWIWSEECYEFWFKVRNHANNDFWKNVWMHNVSPDPSRQLYLNHQLRADLHTIEFSPDSKLPPRDFMDYVRRTTDISTHELINERISV
jgi:hypothetical protein